MIKLYASVASSRRSLWNEYLDVKTTSDFPSDACLFAPTTHKSVFASNKSGKINICCAPIRLFQLERINDAQCLEDKQLDKQPINVFILNTEDNVTNTSTCIAVSVAISTLDYNNY